MMYLKALPKVCPSSRNSKEAAVGVDPGSCRGCRNCCQSLTCDEETVVDRKGSSYQEQLVFLVDFLRGHVGLIRHDGIFSIFCRHFDYLGDVRTEVALQSLDDCRLEENDGLRGYVMSDLQPRNGTDQRFFDKNSYQRLRADPRGCV